MCKCTWKRRQSPCVLRGTASQGARIPTCAPRVRLRWGPLPLRRDANRVGERDTPPGPVDSRGLGSLCPRAPESASLRRIVRAPQQAHRPCSVHVHVRAPTNTQRQKTGVQTPHPLPAPLSPLAPKPRTRSLGSWLHPLFPLQAGPSWHDLVTSLMVIVTSCLSNLADASCSLGWGLFESWESVFHV